MSNTTFFLSPQFSNETQDTIIQEREIEIIKIHQNIKDTNELFRNFAELIDHQASYIDIIQTNITISKNNVLHGTKELADAENSQDTCSLF